jgi:hypothetical protein
MYNSTGHRPAPKQKPLLYRVLSTTVDNQLYTSIAQLTVFVNDKILLFFDSQNKTISLRPAALFDISS